jgi:hypothetical protein
MDFVLSLEALTAAANGPGPAGAAQWGTAAWPLFSNSRIPIRRPARRSRENNRHVKLFCSLASGTSAGSKRRRQSQPTRKFASAAPRNVLQKWLTNSRACVLCYVDHPTRASLWRGAAERMGWSNAFEHAPTLVAAISAQGSPPRTDVARAYQISVAVLL